MGMEGRRGRGQGRLGGAFRIFLKDGLSDIYLWQAIRLTGAILLGQLRMP
jgi:hypothetical protein